MATAIDDKLAEITNLCEKHGVAELYLFGSAVHGDFEPGRSDYDFLVRFQPSPPLGRYESYFGLMEDLEELLQTKVDLVESGAIKNKYLLKAIMESRQLLYAA